VGLLDCRIDLSSLADYWHWVVEAAESGFLPQRRGKIVNVFCRNTVQR
jgi:hypothetical protein